MRLNNKQELNTLAKNLHSIKKAVKNTDLGGGFLPNNVYLDFALKKIRYAKKSNACMCELYPDMVFFNPSEEESAGHILITEQDPAPEPWTNTFLCRCRACGNLFHVEQGESHYTWYQWTKIKQLP